MAIQVVLYAVVVLSIVRGAAPQNLAVVAQDCLVRTNFYRARHQAPPMTLNTTISTISQNWANNLQQTGAVQHSSNTATYGENIYMASSSNRAFILNCTVAVDAWYNEVSMYTYDNQFHAETGHFTQLVWRNSLQLGVGFNATNGRNYVVCNYFPQGNVQGQFAQNVLPPV